MLAICAVMDHYCTSTSNTLTCHSSTNGSTPKTSEVAATSVLSPTQVASLERIVDPDVFAPFRSGWLSPSVMMGVSLSDLFDLSTPAGVRSFEAATKTFCTSKNEGNVVGGGKFIARYSGSPQGGSSEFKARVALAADAGTWDMCEALYLTSAVKMKLASTLSPMDPNDFAAAVVSSPLHVNKLARLRHALEECGWKLDQESMTTGPYRYNFASE